MNDWLSDRVKTFWSFWELPRDKILDFDWLQELNELLEKNIRISVRQVQDSYLKILLETDFENNKFSYSEIDFVVKKVIEDSNLATNSILWFLDFKYKTQEKLIRETLSEHINLWDEVLDSFVNEILTYRIWQINLFLWGIILNWEITIYYDFKNFEFNEALRRFKNNIDLQLKELNKKWKDFLTGFLEEN